MKLSDLNTGEHGVIVKVQGHGGFRKRIIEMGFIKGEDVEVLLNAPLQDPVKYKLMDYEVSLRHQEAEMIEVNKVEPRSLDTQVDDDAQEQKEDKAPLKDVIKVALVGNPNCGKTSLFNFASGAHVHAERFR